MTDRLSQPALSQAQARAVEHRSGDLQLIACARSGKTESMARRVASLVAGRVPPASIVAFTFTERASRDLRERITQRVTDQLGLEPTRALKGPAPTRRGRK
jgi:DNA helicase-2/ATP-dependent DNA helicase PcrA